MISILRKGAGVGKQRLSDRFADARFQLHERTGGFERCGVVEGFFGPPWSMTQRQALFDIGAARGMNTYLYAPRAEL
jgi:hypothetical protein